MALVQERAHAAAEINTLLGRGSEFEGKLVFEGTVRIDGKLKGHVLSDDVLIIGEGAEVHAELEIGTVLVYGTVVGNIKAARSVELHAPGRIRGNISTPSLMVDQGATLQGQCSMENLGATTHPTPPPAKPPAPSKS